eukprot:TRINITY_DN5125_c0_g1_i1.p1 TRINITY_DN5125_c0_g1~~TRINITY_DN5125_c0_g1_i1.p1  ORF type:complete len:133 (+),score=39.15 TRINITY_DN5125_c0_g1_i1:94-492(+)
MIQSPKYPGSPKREFLGVKFDTKNVPKRPSFHNNQHRSVVKFLKRLSLMKVNDGVSTPKFEPEVEEKEANEIPGEAKSDGEEESGSSDSDSDDGGFDIKGSSEHSKRKNAAIVKVGRVKNYFSEMDKANGKK